MNELHLPSLSLFNRVPSKTRKQPLMMTTTNDRSICEVLKESHRIQNRAYLPDIIPSSQMQFENNRLDRYRMEIDYLNAYKDALIKQDQFSSGLVYPPYHQSYRQQSLHSFGRKPSCSCEDFQKKNQKILVKNIYLTSPLNPPSTENNRSNSIGTILNKNPYLNRPQQQHDDPIGDIKKYVQEEKPENLDKSIMINNSFKPPVAEIEVQTEDPKMIRSSFLISKVVQKAPELMNEQNFKKTIRRLNQSINSLNIDLNNQDLIIDLSDLVLTKDQYIEESNTLLSKLNNLSSGKIFAKDNKKGGISWPEGV